MITTERGQHRDMEVLFIRFSYDTNIISKLRQHPDSKWSNTNKAWYIPFSKQSLNSFAEIFPKVDITIYQKEFESKQKISINPQQEKTSNISLEYNYDEIRVYMPYNKDDILFMKEFYGSYWNETYRCWALPNYQDNLTMLQLHFRNRISSVIEVPKAASKREYL